MYETLEVLIPTFNSNKDDIEKLLSFWNVQTNCVISNQCGKQGAYEFDFKGHKVRWFDIDSVGVSKNRNNLLNKLNADLGIFIDDDCSLCNDYEKTILNEMNFYNARAALFNGFNDKDIIINKNNKTIRCKRYSHLSHMGGPGICVSKNLLVDCKLSFNEQLGTPNKIYMGEDSLFAFDLIKLKTIIINSNKPVFYVKEDIDNSTYFKGYDEQYFFSKGAINKLVHKNSFPIWRLYYSFRLSKKTKKSGVFIRKNMKKGEKAVRKGVVVFNG